MTSISSTDKASRMTPLLWQRPSQNQAQSRYHATTNGTPICGARGAGRDDQAARVDRAADRNARVPQMQAENGGKRMSAKESVGLLIDAWFLGERKRDILAEALWMLRSAVPRRARKSCIKKTNEGASA